MVTTPLINEGQKLIIKLIFTLHQLNALSVYVLRIFGFTTIKTHPLEC